MENVINEFKARLLSTNKRNATFFNGFKQRSHSINIQTIKEILQVEKWKDKIELNLKVVELNTKTTNFPKDSEQYKKYLIIKKQINTIQNKATILNSEKNQNPLYIGNFFIKGRLSNMAKDFFLAPLLLKPVNLIKENLSYRMELANYYVINNSLLNLMAKTNDIKWEYNDLMITDADINSHKVEKILKTLIEKTAFSLAKNNDFSASINSQFIEQEFERDKEFAIFGDRDYIVETVPVCSFGIFDLSASEILAAYEEIEKDPEFFNELINANYDRIADEQEVKEKDIMTISKIDYSQKKAIANALNDSTFILGPPGTGKSETITNLLANIIYNKQNALFITEKKVASEVVYNKLGKLNQFALIFHNERNAKELHNTIAEFYNLIIGSIKENNNNISEFNFDPSVLDQSLKLLKEYKDLFQTPEAILYLENEKYIQYDKFLTLVNANEYHRYFQIYHLLINSKLIKAIKVSLNDLDIDIHEKQFWNCFVLQDTNSLSKFIFNKESKNKFTSKVSFFKKRKYNEFLNTKIWEEYSEKIKSFPMDKYGDDDLTTLFDFLRKFKDKNLEWTKEVFTKTFISSFEYQNSEELYKFGYEWYEDIKKNINKKIHNDINLVYHSHIAYVVDKIKNGEYYDSKIDQVKPLRILFNEMGRRIESVSTNMRITTWFKNYYPILELVFPIIIGSPESLSNTKIIAMDKGEFEYCIFDEASQIYIEKCMPAMYRSKKYIVSGDDKQLSPTNFFQIGRLYDNETDDDSDIDAELIGELLESESLIDFAKTRYRKFLLRFHYRSKYQELIQFSNYKYYEGQLNVVSKNEKNSKPIELIDVEGQWIDKVNMVEADQVIQTLKNIIEQYPDKSVGIVTFNSSQQMLIQDKLDEAMEDNKQIFNYVKKMKNSEYLFIKNIENVQGDERDIIIFSIGYATDATGKFRNHFGPINSNGGEKRLNVAISRAKEKMYVIKSINSSIIKPNPNSTGAVHFKEFLKYVELLQEKPFSENEKIQKILNNDTHRENIDNNSEFDSEFEIEVYNAIKYILVPYRDLELHTQVHSSGYLIDQAIYDKKNKNYILAIECDGATFHSSVFDREKDLERQIYLENRGWNFKRILSTHWWENDSVDKNKFLNEVNTFLKEYKY